MSHNITVEGGTSVRLPTAGKYCDRDIVITATGSGTTPEDLSAVLAEQETLIDELKEVLRDKTSGGGGISDTEDGLIARTTKTYRNDRVTSVGSYAFYNHTALESVDLPNVKTVSGYAFYNCTKIASVFLPSATSVGDNSFRSCDALVSVNCPSLTSIATTAFRECAKLTELIIPKVTSIGNYAFHSCSALTRIDLPSISSIATQVFTNCSALSEIIIRKESGVCSVSSIATFTGTPFADGGTGGTLYVPRALVSSYKTSGMWKTLVGYGTCNVVAIEDYPDICGG